MVTNIQSKNQRRHSPHVHPGKHVISKVPTITTRTPRKYKNHPYFQCPCYQDSQITKILKEFKPSNLDLKPGNCHLMDFGFVRGDPTKKEQKENIIASFDGFTLYLLIKASRYGCIFLTKNKAPLIDIVDNF